MILVGDDITISLPSGRPRKPRSDRLLNPALQWGKFRFYRLDTPGLVQVVIDHMEEAEGEKNAWI